MHFLLIWLATSIATLAATAIIPGIEAVGGDYMGPIMCALMLALVNASIKPIMKILSLPITILTLGIFSLVINALMLELASWLSVGLFDAGIEVAGFGSAFFGAIIISVVYAVVSKALGVDDEDD
ncbi:MAG: phage holin family protein [Olegusella sp.]|nr:phage holin family protein [Olegusella sp.]